MQSRPAPSSSALSTTTTSALASSSAPYIPSPDTDAHLTLKKLKVLHSQESNSHTQTSVQTPKQIQQTFNAQSTIPFVILTPPLEVVDIETLMKSMVFKQIFFIKSFHHQFKP